MNFNKPVVIPLITTFFVHVILLITVLSFNLEDDGGLLIQKSLQPPAIKTRLVKSSEIFIEKKKKPTPKVVNKKKPPVVEKKPSEKESQTKSPPQALPNNDLEKLPTLLKVQEKKITPQEESIPKLKIEEANSSLQQSKNDDAAKLEELLKSINDNSTKRQQQEEAARNSEQEIVKHYFARNRSLVEQQFNVNSISQKHIFSGLEVRIKINLDEVGKIEKAVIVESSGNSLFDNRAINAVKRVGKFILPEDDEVARRYFREIIMDYSIQL